MAEMIEIAKIYGLNAAFVVFFVWWSWKREQALGEALNKRQAWEQDVLQGLVAQSATALAQSTEALRNNTETHARISEALEKAPCMKDKKD